MLGFIKRPFIFLLLLAPFTVAADCMGPYPPSMVKAFNANCAKDETIVPFCSCIMDDVQKNIPLADFIEIGNSEGGINNDPRFISASKKCSSMLPGAPQQPQAPKEKTIPIPPGLRIIPPSSPTTPNTNSSTPNTNNSQ